MDDTNQDQGATTPPADTPPVDSTPDLAPEVHSAITDLGRARLLVLIGADEAVHDPVISEGSIDRFVDEVTDEDGITTRPTMRIVVDSTGALRKQACPDEVA